MIAAYRHVTHSASQKVRSHLELYHIHQINHVNYRNDFAMITVPEALKGTLTLKNIPFKMNIYVK